MSNSRIHSAVPGAKGSGIQPSPAAVDDRILSLADAAELLRCSDDEARQFIETNAIVGVDFPSGPRYLQSDLLVAFTASLRLARAQKQEALKLDEMQGLWVTWLNKLQSTLTPSEQDGWVKFARFLVARRLSPAEFFRRSPEERQNFVRLAAVDFRLRDDYGTAHLGLELSKGSGVQAALSGTTRSLPSSRSGPKPFAG
ncbi:MAG: hypothetical protein ACREJ2_05560 [Planctomycetota bacterium]